ncbi:hypothetical protein PCANC_13436 [Puccinia coronata f. sp. avenae]|uniref:Uncharacterized protein n=1 Tax=Puccinia coronata f. sp. avenae TaxID=200324 RepID=A0A2N5V2P8_9BASI|nr:hypothetical protein PCANC_13436 [Puccinia coronata f. sp. avenae]
MAASNVNSDATIRASIAGSVCKQWMDCKSLDKRMAMALDAAAQLDVLAQLPPESTQSLVYHPLLLHRHIPQAPAQKPACNPDAMEIDTAQVFPADAQRQSLLDASRALCRAQQLCFHCLSPLVAGSHTGSLNCPNAPISPEERKAFVACCRQLPLTSVAAVEVPVTRVDKTANGRLLVPVSFKEPSGALFPAPVLVDTGAMANFVNEGFIRKHSLPLKQRKHPVRCVGFDGQEAVGGVVTEDWAGWIQLSTIDLAPFWLPSSFGVTRLGSVDAIFGLPWLDKQGWVASGSLKGGHQFTLRSTPLYVIKSASLGGKPGGNAVLSSQNLPSPSFSLPAEFE